MGTTKPQVKAYIEESDYLKFMYISKKENRKISNNIGYLIKKHIEEYERMNGEIKLDNVSTSDDLPAH